MDKLSAGSDKSSDALCCRARASAVNLFGESAHEVPHYLMGIVQTLIACTGPDEIIGYAIAYVVHIEIVPPTVRS